jgi:hypothetical protein
VGVLVKAEQTAAVEEGVFSWVWGGRFLGVVVVVAT